MTLFGKIMKTILKGMSKKRLSKIEGEISLQGLKNKVRIIRDTAGCPHIYAKNMEDVAFAQGYVQAQDRFWQMELNRRIACGQMSEIFGELALGTDITARAFGFKRIAKQDWELLDEDVKKILQAYTAGVNALILDPNWRAPVELKLLKHEKPRKWENIDSIAFLRFIIWNMSGCWHLELPRLHLLDKVGIDAAKEIEPYYPQENPTVMKNIEMNVYDENGILSAIKGPFITKGGASNSWTISSSLSDTKGAIHCNDMHLGLTVPGIWYYNHLIVENTGQKQLNATGVSLPGVPFVFVGHNEYFSYGCTLARTDCEDLFLEKLDGTKYEFKGEWKEAEVLEEVIKVKNKPAHTENIIITHHGPIIFKDINEENHAISYCGMSLRPSKLLNAYYKINTGKNWDDFVEAMSIYDAPQINFSYADVYGNTGLYVAGKVPIRAKGTGIIPVPGWTGEFDWVDEIPFDKMPHVFNPESGVIVTCNNKLVSDDYPYFLTGVCMNGYRAKRITDLIKEKGIVQFPDDHIELQMDVKSLDGLAIINSIADYQSNDPQIHEILSRLREWDGNASIDSTPGLFYEVLNLNLLKTIFLPILGEKLTYEFFGMVFKDNAILGNLCDMYAQVGPLLVKVLNDPKSWWIEQNGGKKNVLDKAFAESLKWLKGKFGSKWHSSTWGEVHRAIIPHAMGQQKPLGEVFNIPDNKGKPIDGDSNTVNLTAIDFLNPYNLEFVAASYRQIIDLGNFENSYFIYPTGQSGHLASPHYSDMYEKWRTGKYLPMLWSDKQIEANKGSELILNPKL